MDVESILSEIIHTTINSFDFAFVLCVNILGYLVIKLVDYLNGDKPVTTWQKRIIILGCSVLLGVVYFSLKLGDVRTVINSVILSPVAFDFIIKPLIVKLKIDYKH